MSYEKIVTLYDTAQHAQAARRNLESAGFPSRGIRTINNRRLSVAGNTLREPRFWSLLFGRDIQAHEASVYGRAVENGAVVLTLHVPKSYVDRAASILNAH
jgi:hypothetical protein